MKKLIIASGLLALLAAATSCDKYDIYDEKFGDVLLIKDGGDKDFTVYSTDDYAELPVIVMKGGHSPENTASAQLRIMSEDDFKNYLEANYGDANFGGLKMVNPEFYRLRDNDGAEVAAINHNFAGADDRYFTANLRVYSEKFADWYYTLSDVEKNSVNYVIPLGLYSETDSVNEYNNVLIVQPSAVDPEITCNIRDDNYRLDELSRRTVLNRQTTDLDAEGHLWYEPEVYYSMPCKNLWGLTVKIEKGKKSTVTTYNTTDGHTVTLTAMPDDYYELGNEVVFPVGVNKARVPLRIDLAKINPNAELGKNYVASFLVKGKKSDPAIVWENTPDDKIIERLTIANNTTACFAGIVIKETPLEITADDVTSNDCEPSEGSIAALFDDNLSTFFHSTWSTAVDRPAPYGSYLEIALPEEIDECYFQITARNGGNIIPPKTIALYVTDAIADDPEETNWQYFTTVTNPKALTAGESFEIGKIDKMFRYDGGKFRFMRFCVLENNKGVSCVGTSSGTSCWNLAELRVYGRIHQDETETPAE